ASEKQKVPFLRFFLTPFARYWALAGLFVPVALMIVTRLQGGVFEWPYLMIALWPSVVIYAAVDAFDDPLISSLIISMTISIGLNMILYVLFGAIVSSFFRPFEKSER
ncbi:MAG TPA: hypothetical protein VE201_01440, partial [Nitrospirales bacterium]|nr:hypothetical protein [Nitrospirales bacterium]